MADNDLPPGLTLVQPRPVPPGLTLKAAPAAPPAEQKRTLGDMGKEAAGIVAAPGFAAVEGASDFYDQIKKDAAASKSPEAARARNKEVGEAIGNGIVGTLKDAGNAEIEDVTKAGHALKKSASPGLDPLHRAKLAGYGIYKGIQAPFEPEVKALENTYGKLASEGSKRVNDGKALISPQEASILPGMFIGAGGKKLPKETGFGEAVKRFGMDFSKAKKPEDIAAEIQRASAAHADREATMISPRAAEAKPTGQVNEFGEGASRAFQSRKKAETNYWGVQETLGNSIPHDATEQVNALKALKEKTLSRADASETDVKKGVAAIDRALAELGAPVSPEQSIVEKTKEVGGFNRTTTQDKQFPERFAKTTKTVDPTTQVGGGKFSETSQSPVNSSLSQSDKTRTITQDPYTITSRTVKGQAPKPPRPSNAGDLVRANKALNEKTYGLADKGVTSEIRNILSGPLNDISKTDKTFGRARKLAIDATQRNADIYRQDAFVSKLGFDEDTMREVSNAKKYGRMVSTDTLQRISDGVATVDTPEKLLAVKRTLDKPTYSTFLRSKYAAIRDDIGMDPDKFAKAKPMLEEIYKEAGFPKGKVAQNLSDLEAITKEMKRYKVPSELTPKELRPEARFQHLKKALYFNVWSPKQGLFHGLQAIMPGTDQEARSLNAFKGKTQPIPQPANVPGAAIGGILTGTDKTQ